MGLHILYVCTGNVCRSPAAEALLRSRSGTGLTVASAGVQALAGDGVEQSTAAALAELGVPTDQHRARQFEPWMAAQADLVLTAERSHRNVVMAQYAPAHRRTFTMREFARLAPLATASPPGMVIADLARHRGDFGPVDEYRDDVPDPYRAGLERARATVALVADSVDAVIRVLDLAPALDPDPPLDAVPVAAPPRPRPRPGGRSRPMPTRR